MLTIYAITLERFTMKFLCFSDSHGYIGYMQKALSMHPDCEAVFFLGDGLDDITELATADSRRTWFFVRGNCDRTSFVGTSVARKLDSVTLAGKRIVFTHGDLYGAKYGTGGLEQLAEETGADIVLFGHTHTPCEKFVPNDGDGFYLFNPGSISSPYDGICSYGVVNITDSGVLVSHGCFT